MRQSQLFYKSEKTIPKDATTINHQLLLRGGFIKQISAGRYAYLPLGFRVYQKVISVIEQEMNAIGAQRIGTPTFHPIEIWQATNRDKAFGSEMTIVEDHHGSTFALGATAEGLMTELVKDWMPSYRDLPIVIYQFSQKFRDEKRPRGGLLRMREFMMKDAYSFHVSEEDLLKWYEIFKEAYQRIAKRFDLNAFPVLADSGAIGGDYCHEFMVEAPSGEDIILVCNACNYAANVEKAEGRFQSFPQDTEMKERKDIEGKGMIGVEALAKFLDIPVHQTTKTMIYETDKGDVVAVMIRGDYEINEVKLAHHLQAMNVQLAGEEIVRHVTNAEIGYAGPLNLPSDVRVIADLSCKDRRNFEVGSNRTNYHSINVNFERDFPTPEFADIREVKPGDSCIKCSSGVLEERKTIEWAHIFHQAQFYAKPHGAVFTDKDGQQKTLWQGAYGIGVDRSIATIIETHHDKDGIIWPECVAPFLIHLISLGNDRDTSIKAEAVYQKLVDAGKEVLYDDRDVSSGIKLKDSDLLGIPIRLVISEKTGDQIEWKGRRSKENELISEKELFARLEA